MKLKNKSNGIFAEVSDAVGNTLVAAGGWEEVCEPADEPKPVRKSAPKKI